MTGCLGGPDGARRPGWSRRAELRGRGGGRRGGAAGRGPRPGPGTMHAVIPDRPATPAVRSAPAVSGRVAVRVAAAALMLAALLSGAAYAGRPVLVVAVVLSCAVVAAGWTTLLDLPSPRGTTTVVAASGALAAVAVALTRDEPLLEWLAPALAAGVVGEFVHQLGRR